MENIIAFRPDKNQQVKVSELLRLYRTRSKLTQAELADLLDLQSARMIRKWENGESLPKAARLRKLIEVYVREKVFTGGREQREAETLWAAVKRSFELESATFEEYNIFDPAWFQGLLDSLTTELILTVIPPQEETAAQDSQQLPAQQISTTNPKQNLPYRALKPVGREAEISRIKTLLANTRLLTITGAPGVGKTSLALAVAYEVLADFTDGVWYISLTEHSDLTFDALKEMLVELPGFEVITDSGQTTLAGRSPDGKFLLVLDKCDAAVGKISLVLNQLLKSWPAATLLVTSRESFGMLGETIFRLKPFAMTNSNAAVHLFIERAEKILPGFSQTLTPTREEIIARICRKLDGLPLAVELAARLVEGFSLEQIEMRLDNPFHLLKERFSVERKTGLATSFEDSYQRLTSAEREMLKFLAGLSETARGFSLEEIERDFEKNGGENGQALELLYSLVRKSLVEVDKDAAGVGASGRFYLLNLLRKFVGWQAAREEKTRNHD